MEIDSCTDQYEKKLYALFQSYDSTRCGTLNREALLNLCDSLQLEDRGRELTNLLLGDSSVVKVAFSQFRDGLLSVLGGEASNEKSMKILERADILSGEDSSGREVSPKYIFGSKKYGRRSRPAYSAESPEGLYSDTIQETDNSSLETGESDLTLTSSVLPDKAMGNKKRRTNNKLRRSISFTGNRKHDNVDCSDFKKFSTNYKEVSICVDEGSKNIDHDTPDCQRVLSEIRTVESRPHLKGVDCNSNNREVFTPLCAYDEHKNGIVILKNNPHACSQSENKINLAFKSASHIQIYSEDSESSMTSCTIGELWESAGVFKPFQLLNDLGFKGDSAKVAEVIVVLEEEINSINSNMHASSIQNSLTTLTQAVLSLYQYETKTLRTTASQTSAERDKLKTDLLEANQRAILLAHEVDDNHTKMETAAQTAIKLLEQKHSDTLKQLSSRFATEKEQLTSNISSLESKISENQSEELKLKTQLMSSEKKINFNEKELNNLQEQLSELIEVKKQLSKEIKILTSEKHFTNTKDNSSPKMDTLYLEKQLTKLANENTMLRDKNDEAIAELENIYLKISNPREKIKITPLTCLVDIPPDLLSSDVKSKIKELSEADVCGVNGTKRRGDSPSHCHTNFTNQEESPRICKVRKCRPRKLLSLEIDDRHPNDQTGNSMDATFECTNSNENGNIDLKSELAPMEETIDVLCFKHISDEKISKIIGLLEDSKCKTLSDFFRLSCVKHYYLGLFWILERIRNDIIEINKKNSYFKKEFTECSSEMLLQNILSEVITSLSQNIIDNLCRDVIDLDNQTICKMNLSLQDDIMEVETMPNHVLSCNNQSAVDGKIANLLITIRELQSVLESERISRDDERAKEAEKCSVLETNLELLKTEFDKCEDYWASKLDDERDIYDQEQRMSDEKFAELLNKVAEYEDQFASHDNKNDQSNGPLSTIEEKYNLEKQFTDLEDEFEEYKLKSEVETQQFVLEIKQLKEQIEHLENTKINEIVNQPASESEFCVFNLDSSKNMEANLTEKINKELPNGNIKFYSNPFSPDNNVCESKIAFPAANDDISNINSPINYLWNQSTIPSLLPNVKNNCDNARDYHNPAFVKDQLTQNTNNVLKEMPNGDLTKNIAPIQKPVFLKSYSNICQEGFQQNKFGDFKLDKKMLQCSELEETLQGRRSEGRSGGRLRPDAEIKPTNQRIPSQHSTIANGFKAAALEQRCRQLQIALRQQQSYTEAVMQQTVAAHRGEVGALKQQLAAADILVRDLYIENCHLARSLVAPGTQ